jgi:curved DNA-binding protein CbpA
MHDLVEKMLTKNSFSREDFFKLYRILCKNTHPDLTGKDGKDFIRVQELYEQMKNLTVRFDPYKVIRESGFSVPHNLGTPFTADRAALYISLHRYVSLGLHSYKLRSNALLKERNRTVIRTVLYWGNRYDKRFVPLFVDYNKNKFEQVIINENLKHELKGKRLFVEGLGWFTKYQETGRRSSAHIAREKLSFACKLLKSYGATRSPILPFSDWLQGELEREPSVFA